MEYKQFHMYFALIFLGMYLLAVETKSVQVNRHAALWKELTTNYSKLVLPDTGKLPIDVQVGFALSRIERLDEKRQVLSTFGWLLLHWHDPLLSWNLTEKKIGMLIVPAEEIWLPEFAILNSANQGNDLALDSKFRVKVSHTGLVAWYPGFQFETFCTVDLYIFPFDTQTCVMNFTNWMHSIYYLNYSLLHLFGKELMMQMYEGNPEWRLAHREVGVHIVKHSTIKEWQFPVVTVQFILKRNPLYFTLNIVIPAAVMIFITNFVFVLPVESGEKVSLSITLLLCFTVVLLLMSDITPRNGIRTPLITIMTTLALCESATSLIIAVVVVAITYYIPHKPVPGCLQAFCRGVALIGCLNSESQHVYKSRKKHGITNRASVLNEDEYIKGIILATGKPAKLRGCSPGNDLELKEYRELKQVINELKDSLSDFAHKLATDPEKDYSEQWRLLGMCIDRMFLVMHLICGFGMTIYFLLMMHEYNVF